MDAKALEKRVSDFWEREVVPALMEFIRIPNESPAFDREWRAHGHMDRAVQLVADWIGRQGIAGCTVDVLRDGERTPLVFVEIEGRREGTVVIYGHLDKQPPMVGWRDGLGPWTPVLSKDGKLYGRGSGDDGYAVFAAVSAIEALQALGAEHPRIVLLIECSEESGSHDLPHYLNSCKKRIGRPELVICLDSGCGNYERLWCTTSLRGLLMGSLKVEVLDEGVHSGMAGGIVPSPIRILRRLLDRLEDPDTGDLRPEAFHVEIPQERIEQARQAAEALGNSVVKDFPFVAGARPESDSVEELLIRSSWKAALAITGQEGIPAPGEGGNVLLPFVKVKLSIRIPPGVDPGRAGQAARDVLQADPPYGAKVTVSLGGMSGWEAPPMAPWLGEALHAASRAFFGRDARLFGAGGTIPFMPMIGRHFPEAQFLTTGVLGPHSNAHGPNEFLHVPFAKKLCCCLAQIIAGIPPRA
ncbi:MAG: M20/M25/M40 family metallo-hydrolase [SAR324 cluster bacterium]|nr:M20/M25/M40 family metallo-hydrolase [SAR324 cluster bacterium]